MNSFITDLMIAECGPEPFPGVFIRAPAIESFNQDELKLFAKLPAEQGGLIVGVYNDDVLGIAFHPEFTNDARIHLFFLKQALKKKKSQQTSV